MRIGIGTRWFIDITVLLTYDFPFIFYDGITIELQIIDVGQRHCGGESRRWCDDERRRNTDVQIDDRLQIRKNVDEDQHLIDTDKLNSVNDL